MAETFPVVFLPSGRRGEFAAGTPLLEAARQLGVDIDSVCGGRGLCGRCQIHCMTGDFPKHSMTASIDHLSAFTETERRFEARKGVLATGRRLSCHALIEGPLLIDVPPESQVHRQVVRKSAVAREIDLDLDFRLHYVTVSAATLDDGGSDLSRLKQALADQWGLADLIYDTSVLAQVHTAIVEGEGDVTVAVFFDEARPCIGAVWPGLVDTVYGIAMDIGSTTVALHLTDLTTGDVIASNGAMNPQIRFGEDLMSRVSYVLMQPEGAGEMTREIRATVNQLIAEAAAEAGIETAHIVEMAVAGNPIMHHLFLGVDPSPLGSAPFELAIDEALLLPARELGLAICPGGRLYLPPCIAGHVGADTTSVILSEQPYKSEEITLIVDIGTNAEIVLGNERKLLACSSPTGPAFEGAQLSCGQRATAGAIERVRIDPDTLAVRYRVIGSELWSDNPEFAASVAEMNITGICGSGIIEAIAEMYLAGVLTRDGVIRAELAETSDRVIPDGRTFAFELIGGEIPVRITQNDVRQIQLAKAALYAGVKLLMDRFPVETIDRIKIAGAFGSNIDVKYAMVLGLIPDCALDQVVSVGNAASTGVRIALLNQTARAELEAVVEDVEKVETATEADFQQYFVDAMAIPHKSDPFDQLFQVVAKPVEVATGVTGGGRAGRKGRRNRPR